MSKLLLTIFAIIALFCLLTNAQEDTEQEPEQESVSQFAEISIDMRMPHGYDVIEWEKILTKLSPDCGEGFGAQKLLKDGPGEETFKFLISLGEQSFEEFSKKCQNAFEINKDDLRRNGKVKLISINQIELPSSCIDVCGVEECPCPLLSLCLNNDECGPDAECVTSTRNPDQMWCVSSNSYIISTFFVAFIVILGLFC